MTSENSSEPSISEKIRALHALGTVRKADRLSGHRQIFEFGDGRYDTHPWVSPWTISAKEVDSKLLIIAQDWASEDFLEKIIKEDDRRVEALGHVPDLPTNTRLFSMLKKYFLMDFSETFGTNLFPFVKGGKNNSPIKSSDLKYCAEKYCLPQISIVAPKMAICLGAATSRAVVSASSGVRFGALRDLLKDSVQFGPTKIFFAYHPGGYGTASAGGAERVDRHWEWLGEQYRELLKA